MSNKITDYTYIQRFFEFQLSPEELQGFNERLESDPRFFQRVKAYRYIDDKIDKDFVGASSEENQAFQQLWQDRLANNTPKRAVWMSSQRWWSVAASFFLILSIAMWWWNSNNPAISYQQLALNHWEESVLNLEERSGSTDEVYTSFNAAAANYQVKEYEQALVQLQAIALSSPLYGKTLLLQGQCYFKLELMEEAIHTFQTLIELQDGEKDRAYWYQTLAYVHIENIGAAKKNLRFIIEQNYPLAKRAKILLEEL